MNILGPFQALVLIALGVGSLVLTGYAFIDALRRPNEAFVFAGKRNKITWVLILAVALAIVFVLVVNPLSGGLFTIISLVAAGYYLADVRPAVRQYRGRGGRNAGPYGGY